MRLWNKTVLKSVRKKVKLPLPDDPLFPYSFVWQFLFKYHPGYKTLANMFASIYGIAKY